MKYLYLALITFLVVSLEFPLTARAASSGDLIKGSGSAVYYFGADSKRYVFPNAGTYLSWYYGFDNIKTIPDSELASYPIGGNVTYRPGVRLVKITTDPKTYAVTKNGVLRWVQSEALARALYGDNWSAKVDDIADAFFTNYRVGTPITATSDYDASVETGNVRNINTDKGLAVGG